MATSNSQKRRGALSRPPLPGTSESPLPFRMFAGLILIALFFTNPCPPAATRVANPQRKTAEKIIPVIEDQSFIQSKEESAILIRPGGLAIGGENIYVLDSEDGCVRLFDLRGNYLGSIGRPGKGPGEFNRPEELCLDVTNNRVVVADTENRRVQFLDTAGRLKESLNLIYPPTAVAMVSDRLYILAFPGNALVMKKEPLIKVYDAELEPAGGFCQPVQAGDLTLNLLANTLLIKTDKAGQLVVAHQFAINEVQVFDRQDKLKKRFEILFKGTELARPGLDIKIRHNEDLLKIAYLVSDLAFDSANNYYFLAGISGRQPDGEPEKGREIYKYSPQGKYLGTILLPVAARLIAFSPDDALYLIDENYDLRKFILAGGDRK